MAYSHSIGYGRTQCISTISTNYALALWKYYLFWINDSSENLFIFGTGSHQGDNVMGKADGFLQSLAELELRQSLAELTERVLNGN